MKRIIVATLMVSSLFAGLMQTSGPMGGALTQFTTAGDALYGLAGTGTIFKYENNSWTMLPYAQGVTGITSHQDELYAWGYYGLYTLNGAQTWDQVYQGNLYNTVSTDGRLFTMTRDSIFHSLDGITWELSFDSLRSEVEFFGDTLMQSLVNPENIWMQDSLIVMSCFGQFSMTQGGLYASRDSGRSWFEPAGLTTFDQSYYLLESDGILYNGSAYGVQRSLDFGQTWSAVSHGLPEDVSLCRGLINFNGRPHALFLYGEGLYSLMDTTWSLVHAFDSDVFGIQALDSEHIVYTDYENVLALDTETMTADILGTDLIATTYQVHGVSDDVAMAYSGYRTSYLTQNGGESWDALPFNVIRVAHQDDELFYVDDNGVWSTSDFGEQSELRISGLPSDELESISDLVVDGNDMYLGLSRTRARTHLTPVWEAGGVYRSDNGGVSWTRVVNGIPSEAGIPAPVYTLFAHNGMVITRTIDGVFRSLDRGATWTRFEQGLGDYGWPSGYVAYDDKIVVNTYMGIMVCDRDTSAWVDMTADLETEGSFLGMRLFQDGGTLYVYDTFASTLYRWENDSWVAAEPLAATPLQITNFSVADGKIWAGVRYGGIWAGEINSATAIDEQFLPQRLELSGNYPNPFNPSTELRFTLPEAGAVTLTVYNLMGQEVVRRSLAHLTSGSHTLQLNASDWASGSYLYTLTQNGQTVSGKMLLIK